MDLGPQIQELKAAPWTFSLGSAWRLLDAAFGREALMGGTSVRFRNYVSLAFPPSRLLPPERPGDRVVELVVPALSLLGRNGPLPDYWTSDVLQSSGAPELVEFLDVFVHRLVAVYGLAVTAGGPWDGGDGRSAGDGPDAHARFFIDLLGLEPPGGVAPEFLVRNAPLLTAAGSGALAAALGDYFDTTARVVPPGGPDDPQDDRADFYLEFGPLPWDRYRQFLPGGNALVPALRITRLFVGVVPRFGLRLKVTAKDRPDCAFDLSGPGLRVDWTARLPGGDDSDVLGVVSATACERVERGRWEGETP